MLLKKYWKEYNPGADLQTYKPGDSADFLSYKWSGLGGRSPGHTHDNISIYWTNKNQSIVIEVDYRKPPQHCFPMLMEE